MTRVADFLLIDAKPPKDAVLPGGNGLAFDWRLARRLRLRRGHGCSPAGSTPDNVAEAIALTGAFGVDVSSGVESAPGVKDETKIRAFVAAARRAFARATEGVESNGQARQAQFLPQGPGRARPLRHLWRALRRRDPDAADPLAGKGLRSGEGRPVVPGRARPFPQALCRAAEPALFRRAADREARRREDLFQARRAQPHRRAQDQQRARPDPARPPHGQEAHHRRDRRGPARRRHRHRLRPLRPATASSTWARSTSSGRSRTSSA